MWLPILGLAIGLLVGWGLYWLIANAFILWVNWREWIWDSEGNLALRILSFPFFLILTVFVAIFAFMALRAIADFIKAIIG